MRIYNFEVSGKLKLDDDKGNNELPLYTKIKKKIIDKVLDKLWEIILGTIFSLILLLGLLLPEGSFLELLFRFHKTAIYSILFFLVAAEVAYLIDGLKEKKPFWKLITHVISSLILFFILFVLNLGVYENVVGPKLTTIEVIEPKEGDKVSKPTVEAKVFVRNLEIPIYFIVETPQGTHWVQAKRFIPHNQFKTTLIQEVRLGEGYIGIGELFKIFAIGTKEDLEIRYLEKIPPHSIVSNIVTVKRVD